MENQPPVPFFPVEHQPEGEKERIEVAVRFGFPSHEKEYVVHFGREFQWQTANNYLPNQLSENLQEQLGGEWQVDNAGTRLEVSCMNPRGHRDDRAVLEALKKALALLAEQQPFIDVSLFRLPETVEGS